MKACIRLLESRGFYVLSEGRKDSINPMVTRRRRLRAIANVKASIKNHKRTLNGKWSKRRLVWKELWQLTRPEWVAIWHRAGIVQLEAGPTKAWQAAKPYFSKKPGTMLLRWDTTKPWALENVHVVFDNGKEQLVIADGYEMYEQKINKIGLILPPTP